MVMVVIAVSYVWSIEKWEENDETEGVKVKNI
jgi:hypothetical protein